jgi:hypothetical protein
MKLAVAIGVIAFGIVVIALVHGPASHQQPSSPAAPVSASQKYIDDLVSQGLMSQPAADRQQSKLLWFAAEVCAAQHKGMDEGEIVSLIRDGSNINTDQAHIIISAAELDMCGGPS